MLITLRSFGASDLKMRSKVLYILLLLTVLRPDRTWADDCDDPLLLLQHDKGTEKFCPKTNESKLIITSSVDDPSVGIFYDPRDGGTILALSKNKLITFVRAHSTSMAPILPKRTNDLPHGICSTKFAGSSADVATDWITGIVYLAYPCGKILAYHPNRLRHATVYEDPKNSLQFIATYPRQRLLIWTQRASIRRAFMDGTGVRVLAEVARSTIIGGLAIDQETSHVYWNEIEWNRQEIFQCDLGGGNRRRLDLSVGKEPSNIAVWGNIIYWQEETLPFFLAVYRADIQQGTKQLVLNNTQLWDLEILSSSLHDTSITNPCANNTCTHMCVQSSTEKPVCLCRDGYVVHKDGRNCTPPRYIFLSKPQGISRIPSFKRTVQSARIQLDQLNTSNPSHVQCDSVRDRLYWADRDNESIRIMWIGVDQLDKAPEIVFQKAHIDNHYPGGELQAFALDWVTSNLYMILHGQRRILACSSSPKRDGTSAGLSCAELFGNKVAASVGGLALDPHTAKMYWTEQDDNSLAVRSGGMDGKGLSSLKSTEIKNPASIAINGLKVYWVDSCGQRIEHISFSGNRRHRFFESTLYPGFLPQRISVEGDILYWAGIATNGSSEAILSIKLGINGPRKELGLENIEHSFVNGKPSGVTGLAVYDATAQVPKRNSTCAEGQNCSGICLLSGEDSLRCVCPIGHRRDASNKTSCLELEKPTVLYNTALNHTVMMKKGQNINVSLMGLGVPVTFDPLRSEILWLANGDCIQYSEEGNVSVCLRHQSVIHRQAVPDPSSPVLTPPPNISIQESLEARQSFSWTYDWIGMNVYFVDERSGVGICSTKTGKFKTIRLGSAEVRKLVLDPLAGYMYWTENDGQNLERTGVWRSEMDGAKSSLLVQRFDVTIEPDMSMDHASTLLFWVEKRTPFRGEELWEVMRSDLAQRTISRTIQLRRQPLGIQVAGNTLFWTTSGSNGIMSCEKETGNNLIKHPHRDFNAEATGFLIINPPSYYQVKKNVCAKGGLCSHICIPTPAGYMKCLCPRGCKLLPDGWNCECGDAKADSTPKNTRRMHPHPKTGLNAGHGDQPACPGNLFPCSENCLELDKVCNGFIDCADYSDEGERCNEECGKDKNGCLHNCTSSARGPICVCPPDQFLANDNKSCRLTSTTAVETEKWRVVLIVCGVVGLVLLMIIFLVTFKYRQTKSKLRNLSEQEVLEFLRGDPAGASSAPDGLDRAMLLPYTHVLSPNDIIIARDKVLGSGEYGVVHPGIFDSQPVAIKTFKRTVDIDEFKAVLAELKMLAYLGDHDLILKFVGAEISEIAQRKLLIVTELSPEGDLLRFLWRVRKHGLAAKLEMDDNISEVHARVTIRTLHKWCVQIVTGMEYLAQKQIVHADLAARNILVFKDHVVKISDFGLSKQLYGCSQYERKKQCKLPWRWAAIELLTCMQFSEASDVWAFGVTAWEIFTLGQTPFKDTTLSNEFIQFLQAGNRLPHPEYASDAIYKVLLECWDAEKSRRPNFLQLQQIFQDMALPEFKNYVLRDTPTSAVHEEGANQNLYVEAV